TARRAQPLATRVYEEGVHALWALPLALAWSPGCAPTPKAQECCQWPPLPLFKTITSSKILLWLNTAEPKLRSLKLKCRARWRCATNTALRSRSRARGSRARFRSEERRVGKEGRGSES